MLIPPGWAVTRISPPGALFAVEVDQHALMAELQARRPDEVRRNLGRIAMPELASGERSRLLAAASGTGAGHCTWHRWSATGLGGGPVHRAHGRPGAARRREPTPR
ncbi:MAG: hypothetical protein MZV63_27035 [Marinilabiliales bacterium]|nr:hypothetical protein [Marinilabiliales bacterium]